MPPLSSADRRSHRGRASLLLLALAIVAPAAVGAQATSTGGLTGRVVDANGAALPAATLTLLPDSGARPAAATAVERTTTTDAAGAFRFSTIPIGTYRVRAQRIGHRASLVTGVVVQARLTTELRITLPAATTELAPMVIAAPAVTIRRENTELGTVVSAEVIDLLPVGLDTRAIVALTPGARPEAVWGGASAQANSYHLDGVAIDHPGIGGQLLEPNVSWIQALEVKGLGAGADLGNFQGAVINALTKSGTNTPHGALRVNVESHRFNDSNIGVAEAVPELSGRRELDAELSGPLVRDRLFYYASGQLLRRESRVLDQVVDPTQFAAGLDERQDLKLFGKLTLQATAADLLSLSVVRADASGDRVGRTGFETAEATHELDAGAHLATLAWQRRTTDRGWDASITASGSDDRRLPFAGTAVPGIASNRPVDPRLYQNPEFDEERRARTLSGALSWRGDFAVSGTAHVVTAGLEHASSTWLERRSRNGGLTWRPSTAARNPSDPFIPDAPGTWFSGRIIPMTTGGEVNLDAATENSAVYVQDDIAFTSRVSVHPGLRWGRWAGRLRPAEGGSRFTAVRDQAFEPRLGVTIDVSGDNSLVLKGHIGRYHQHLFARMFDRAAGSAAYTNEQYWYYDGATFTDPTTVFTPAERDSLVAAGDLVLVEERILDETGGTRGYSQPYVDQWAASVEKTFGANWKAEARWVSRRNRNAVALVDRNVERNHGVFENVRVLDKSGAAVLDAHGAELVLPRVHVPNNAIIRFLEEQRDGRQEGNAIAGYSVADLAWLRWEPDYELTAAPGGTRRFDQLQAIVTGQVASWMLSGSLVVTRLEGNITNVSGYDDERSRGAGPWVRPNEQLNFTGQLDEASEVEGKLIASGLLPWGLRGGGVVTVRSGDRTTPTFVLSGMFFDFQPEGAAVIARTGTNGLAGQQVFVEERGHYRHPARALLDLHLERAFAVGRGDVALVLDVFNVFGEDAVTRTNTRLDAYGDTFATSAYGAARAREAPRTIRVGTALSF